MNGLFTLPKDIEGVPVAQLLAIAWIGALGSTVSMMMRIADFENLNGASRTLPFVIGLFRPIIGASFALFIYALVNSGLITISLSDPSKQIYFVLALTFIAGFGERFVPDVFGHVERQYVRAQAKQNGD
jgi:hypothetical protein